MTLVLRCAIICLFMVNIECAENLALHKPANQTAAWSGLTADKAVDGRYGSPDGGQYYCAHPDNSRSGRPAEWWVDLQDTYLVDNVTIYNTFDSYGFRRMTQFIISVGSTIDTRTDCGGPYMDIVPRGGNVTITCNIRGRFVHFKRIGGFESSLVALCEVEVYGRKDIDCSRCPVNVPCNGITGCSQCEAGKLPPDCVRACPDMTYGINCSSQCGRCRINNVCNKSSGYCPSNDGCELWFAGQKCDVEVVVPQRTDEDIKLGQITKDKIEVTWQQIKNLPSVTEGYYKYRVDCRRVGDSDYQAQLIVLHHSSTRNSATIGNLTYNTKYEIRVTPFREMGDSQDLGSAYSPVTGRTKCGVPESPTLLSVKVESSKTSREIVKLKYESVLNLDSRCNNLEQVWVEYRLNGTQTWLRNDCDLHNTTCTLLPPNGGIYAIRLTVKNDGGVSGSSNVEYVSVQDFISASNQVIKIVVPLIIIIVLILAVLLFVWFYLRKKNLIFKKQKQRPTIEVLNDGTPNVAFMPPTPSPKLKSKQNEDHEASIKPLPPEKPKLVDNKITSNKPTFTVPKAVDVSHFDEYVKNKKKNMSIFSDEYKNLPSVDKSRHKLAITTLNKSKNRFANIYAYDENRVILQIEEDGEEDYINANYITGYNGPKEYIATQGPKSQTIVDLWRMIWQENSNRIIMLANLFDDGKQRCSKYWPDSPNEEKTFGKFTIICESIEKTADYTTRILIVKKENKSRKVHQFHFTSWEDKNKPLNGAITLFAFYNKVRNFDRMSKGPMVVHCSAGVGRTGTFIAFDVLVKQAAEENKVDIYGWITKLRNERMLMVQTKEQYIFLHDALAEYLVCGSTSYHCNDFKETFATISSPSIELGGISEVDRQYNLLLALNARPDGHHKDGLRESNKAKNRDLEIIPDDDSRPYLSTRYKQGNNYINAVYVPSFREHDYYIVTQMPLTNTIVDFWRLVRDMDCHAIIMLNELDHEDETCPPYWPDDDEPKQRYGPLEVELINSNLDTTSKNIITRDFRVILASEKKQTDDESDEKPGLIVRQFQLLSWPKDERFPPNKADLVALFDQLQNWQKTRITESNVKEHCIVHCMNGAQRSGLYCGATYVVDKIRVDQTVDAFLAGRYVGRKRPQFFNTKEQYTFLYEMAVYNSSLFHEYANM